MSVMYKRFACYCIYVYSLHESFEQIYFDLYDTPKIEILIAYNHYIICVLYTDCGDTQFSNIFIRWYWYEIV